MNRAELYTNVVKHLEDNPCRGLVAGMDGEGRLVQMSWIMGRSPSSQNRVYVVDGNVMRTEEAKPTPGADLSLIIYNAMNSHVTHGLGAVGLHIVSNGDQTDSILKRMLTEKAGIGLQDAANNRFCEPDAPVLTPRITAVQSSFCCPEWVAISVLKSDPIARAHWIEASKKVDKEKFKIGEGKYNTKAHLDAIDMEAGLGRFRFPTIHDGYSRKVAPGLGYMVTTYMPGSKDLPSFNRDPILVPIEKDVRKTMEYFWTQLDPRFKVAIGGRTMQPNGEVVYAEPINRFEKVAEGTK